MPEIGECVSVWVCLLEAHFAFKKRWKENTASKDDENDKWIRGHDFLYEERLKYYRRDSLQKKIAKEKGNW